MRELSVNELFFVSGAKQENGKTTVEYSTSASLGAATGGGLASMQRGASGDRIARGAGRVIN